MTGRVAMALVAAFCLAAIPATAQTKLTLEQAVRAAFEKNPSRKAAVFEQHAAAADIKLARSFLLPQISFGEAYQRSNDPVFVFGARLRQNSFTTGDFALNRLNTPLPFGSFATRFSGAWQLFDSGVSWLRVRQSKQMEAFAQQRLNRADQEIVMRVVDAYTGLLLAIRAQQVAEDALQTAQALLDRSRANVSAGMVVESDALSAQVNQAARKEDLIRGRNNVELARAQLDHEMGVAPDTQFEPAELLEDKLLPLDAIDVLERRALEHRPDLQGLKLQQSVQSDAVRAATAAFGPRVNAVADWEMDNPHFTGSGGNNWLAGVEVQIDLFAGGAKKARLDRERAMKNRVDALHEAAVQGVRLEVHKAYLDFDATRQQLEVARAAVGQAHESLRIGQNRYESGLNTVTDVLRMQEAVLRAETNYWQSLYRLRTSYASLELATGTLDINSAVVKP